MDKLHCHIISFCVGIYDCVIPQCSLSCDGGIKSRTVKCVAKQPSLCSPSSRPRSTILCNLQSCSSSNRWTGSPFRPRFRPRVPPKIPTQAPRTQTPGYSTTIIPPNTSTPITTHTNTSTTSDIIHEDDDRDFILVKDGNKDNGGQGAVPTNTKVLGAPEDEEGSTDLQPPNKSYTMGYDYIVEDPTGEERARNDDMFTSTPTSTVRPTTTQAPMHTNTGTIKPTTTSRTQYIDLTTHQSTKTSPYKLNTTPNPKVPHTQSPQVTLPTVKILRKASQTPKGPNKGKTPKAVRQRPETATSTDDYGNLNAREPISRSAFWEVGNWSDVRMQT